MRDWFFVEDHCVAIDHILQADVAGQTFNVGGRAEHVNISIVRMICALLDERFAIDATLGVLYPDCPASKGVSTSTLIASVQGSHCFGMNNFHRKCTKSGVRELGGNVRIGRQSQLPDG